MRRRVGVVISLDLDDDAADAVHQQRGANQVRRDLVDAAVEEGAFQRFAGLLLASRWFFGHRRRYKTGRGPRRAVAVLGPPD